MARASQLTIVAISLINAFVSLALVDAERSRLSFALTQGCVEMCTLAAILESVKTVREGSVAVCLKDIAAG